MIRLFDLLASLIGFIILSPLLLVLTLLIVLDSGLPVFYRQERIGKGGMKFRLIKFRTMKTGGDKSGLLTVGSRDSRITRVGYFLRKSKMDELPQLLNVIMGDMALVGPRPEVEKYVNLYSQDQMRVLDVKPGITDLASIEYLDENALLGSSDDPEKTYIEEIMPHKIEINLKYLEKRNFWSNIGVLFQTVVKIFR